MITYIREPLGIDRFIRRHNQDFIHPGVNVFAKKEFLELGRIVFGVQIRDGEGKRQSVSSQ